MNRYDRYPMLRDRMTTGIQSPYPPVGKEQPAYMGSQSEAPGKEDSYDSSEK